MPGVSRCDLTTRVLNSTISAHAAIGRIGRPAFPAPLLGRKLHQHLERIARRELYACLEAVIASAARQSILSLGGEMDCFAALAMTLMERATPSVVIIRESG